jgi:HemK-related putative methylase
VGSRLGAAVSALRETLALQRGPHATTPAEPFVCPACLGALVRVEGGLRCAEHGAYGRSEGVWRLLPSDRARRYERFVRQYRTVRRAEGRGGEDAGYYRALPFVERSDPLAWQWRIRAASYRALLERVIVPLERARGVPLEVLDLGAGNGWLSHRLALRGHRPMAVDLSDDELDGLGAHRCYGADGAFTAVQADFDRLPLPRAAVDLVVFNAALHYATDVAATLAEALRVLRPNGTIAIVDSPFYRSGDSGRRMVAEREASFTERYGFPSNAIPSESWLTTERLAELGAGLGVRWRVHRPWLGLRWALRPWAARVRRRREPSSFLLAVGTRDPASTAPTPTRRRGVAVEAYRAVLRVRQGLVRGRLRRPVWETVAGRRLLVQPGVFNPRLLRTGTYLAEFVRQGVVRPHDEVLDLGTGSGASAIAAGDLARRVVAVDVNPAAVRCATENAARLGLDRVEVRTGDLFDALLPDERFDVVLFNPPFFRGAPRSPADTAWRSVDVPERFAHGLAERLTPRGRALVLLSSDGDVADWLRPCREEGFDVRLVARRDLWNEVFVLYRIAPPRPVGSARP